MKHVKIYEDFVNESKLQDGAVDSNKLFWTDDPDEIKKLLDQGADPNFVQDGKTPLLKHLTNRSGYGDARSFGNKAKYVTQIAKMLLDRGADPNFQGRWTTPIREAAASGLTEVVKMLLAKGAKVSSADDILASPSYNGYKDIVKLLLDNGANLNFSDEEGKSPLFYALDGAQDEVIKLLLDKGANPNALGQFGRPLMFSFDFIGNRPVAKMKAAFKMFLDKGADPNAKDRYEQTPLLSTMTDRPDWMKMLLDKGADPNMTDRDGVTPLHWAADRGQLPAVKLLLDKGANPNATTKGKTSMFSVVGAPPLEYVSLSGDGKEIAKLLLKSGADSTLCSDRTRKALEDKGLV
jgi:ankyrin repeat protein